MDLVELIEHSPASCPVAVLEAFVLVEEPVWRVAFEGMYLVEYSKYWRKVRGFFQSAVGKLILTVPYDIEIGILLGLAFVKVYVMIQSVLKLAL